MTIKKHADDQKTAVEVNDQTIYTDLYSKRSRFASYIKRDEFLRKALKERKSQGVRSFAFIRHLSLSMRGFAEADTNSSRSKILSHKIYMRRKRGRLSMWTKEPSYDDISKKGD